MERREPSVARSSRPPVYPRCGQSQGLVPAASSRMGSPKPSASPPAPSRRMVTRRHSEDDETAFPTALPPIDVSERIALVPAPRRPLRVAALATSRRQPLPKPRERRESACGLQQPSVATGSPKKCAVPRQRPEGWFRKDMGDSMYVAVPARDAVEVDKSTAALLKGAIAEDRHGSPATGEAEEALPNAAAAAPVPASRAPGRPQVTAERRGTRPVPRSGVQVYVELRKPDKEKRGDKRVGLRTGFPRSQSPINEDPETPARHSGAISEVSLTVDTGIQHQRRTSLLKNISTSISAALGRFFHKGAGAEQVQPAPRSGQATRTEWNDDIEAALNVGLVANDETKTTGQRGESNVRSRYYRDRCEGLAASGISLTQIVSVTRRTEARKPLAPRHMDKQQQPPRRGKAEPEQSHAKLLEVAELSAKPSYHADKQHTLKEAKAEPMESYSDLPEVKELPPELPYHSDGEQPPRRVKGEPEERSAEVPEVPTEVSGMSSSTKGRRASEGSAKGRGKNKRKKSASAIDVIEKTITEDTEKSELKTKDKPGRRGSKKDDEVTEMSSGTKGRRASEGGSKGRGKNKRKKSASTIDVIEKTIIEDSEKSELKTKGKPERIASKKDDEVTEMSSGTKGRRASQGGSKGRGKNKRKKSASAIDVIEKTITEDTEKSELKTKGKPERRGSKKDDEVTEMSSGTKDRRASEGGSKGEGKSKRKKSASTIDVTEKTIIEDTEKSELKAKGKPGRRASNKNDEVTETSSGTKGRRASEGGPKGREKTKRKKSASTIDVIGKTIIEDTEKSELKTKGKPGRRGSKKNDEVTEMSSGTKGRRASEGAEGSRRKKKRKKSASAIDVTEKTTVEVIDKSELETKRRPGRKGSKKDDEFTETSTGVKGRQTSEGGERDGRKTKRKKSAASSELTEQAIEEGNDKSEMGSRGKSKRKSSTVQGPGRKASLKKEEITELTSGAPGASGALEGGRKRSDKRDRKESTPGGDVTEKNVADETEQSSLRTTGMSRRKSSALDKREKEPSGKVSEKKGDVEEAGKSEANGNDRERRISRTGKAIERKHDAEEAGSPDSKVVVPSKLPGDRKKSSPERDTAEDGASQERPVVKKRRPSQAGLLNGTEEAGARNIALLSPPTMPDKETRAEKRRSSCQARLPVVVEGQRDDKKDSAESSASEGKRKKRRRSKGERSAESDVTGEKREDSAIVQDVGRTTGSKTSLGGRRASTKKRPSKSKRKQSGAFKSRDESSRDAEKQLAATKEMEQPLASGQDVAQTLVVREEAALVALPVDGALLPLKSNERSTAADKEADAVVRERQVQSPATAEATAAEPGTAPPSLQPGAVSQERRRSTQGGQVGADKDLELEGLDGSLQGGPSKVPAPEADDGEPSRRCKLSSEKETKDANDNGKTGPLVPSQESGPPGGGKQDDVHLPVTVTEDKDNRLKEKGRDDVAGDGKSRKAESEGKDPRWLRMSGDSPEEGGHPTRDNRRRTSQKSPRRSRTHPNLNRLPR
ncbi:treacle protein-like [Dermacentor silvarum]|uniref:treacle protein-like n=1 Tax=Dermacentor silvarum TaxID=543639 RepID=UPI00189A16C8|nr:treacle protein-like [Dermacentor silvarum]